MTDAEKVPARLGKFELLDQIEEGAGGRLYHARQTETGRPALVKVVAPALTHSASFAKYFYDTWADQKSLMEHPNVLQVWDVGKEGDLQYVAVEDAGGQPLSERMKSGPMETDEVLGILHQTAEGLRAAHRREVAHGHLKPADIILTADEAGRPLVKVAFFDLGVSAADSMAPVFGELLGSPKYMAPEVIQGRAATPESDVFSLGVIAYQMLTGKEPFPSDTNVGYLFANCSAEAAPADQVRQGLPHEVALVVARMLAKEPAQRYRSVQRLTDDLDRCAACMKTGRVEVVPYGTDSAFARAYEITPPGASKWPAAHVRWLGYAAVVVVVACFIAVAAIPWARRGAVAGPQSAQGTLIASPEAPQPTTPPPPIPAVPAVAPVAPAAQTVAPAPEAPAARQPAKADEPQAALDKAAALWKRHQDAHDYEIGVAAFSGVVSLYPESPVAADARRQVGQLYTEWARFLSDQGDFAGAVDKYKKAVDSSPTETTYTKLAHDALPATIVRWADAEQNRGNYGKALDLYQEVAHDYPGTMEANLLDKRRPELLLNSAEALWKDKQDYDGAAGTFAQVVRDYANTDWAKKAQAQLPNLYLESIRQKLDKGDLAEARRQLAQLAEAYPNQDVARKAQELDAEVLFDQFKQASDAGDAAKIASAYSELVRRHPDSQWTVKAFRAKGGLERTAAEPSFSGSTARSQLKDAQKFYDAFDYAQGLQTLKSVLRFAKEDSPEATEALALLPAWSYEDALYAYGKGLPADCKKKLADLSAQFPGTVWAARSAQTLTSIEKPPEGMVYVPEGRFRMGTDMDTITQILRDQHIEALSADPDALKMAAGFYGLLNETPQHTATTGAYFIDKTEVTNQRYKDFLDATGYPPPAQWKNGTYPEGEGSFPVAGVTLADAQRFAKWRNCRLPTEAEWEKAARGTDGRRFPWGDVWQDNRARHMLPATAGPAAVGSFPAWQSPYGCLDVIGNVQEWTSSDFAPYEGSLMEAPAAAGQKVVRGGAWERAEIVPIPSACATRYPDDPAHSDVKTGFRCVKDALAGAAPATAGTAAVAPAAAARATTGTAGAGTATAGTATTGTAAATPAPAAPAARP